MAQTVSFSGKTCLIASTDEMYGQLIESAFQQTGLSEVSRTDNMAAAVEKASVVFYDVVVCAHPETNLALEMMHSVRKTCPKAPVIIVTSQVSADYLATVAAIGSAFVVAMPINTRKLLKTLHRAFNDRPAPPAKPSPPKAEPRAAAAPEAPPRPAPARETRIAPPAPEPGEMLSERDTKLLNAANQISDSIERMRQSLNATDDAAHRRQLRQQLADAAQRLVNLLSLEKLGDGGSLGSSLAQKLNLVREAFFDVIAEICRSRVDVVRSDLDKYLERKEFVVGYVDSVFDRLASIEEIVTVMGGPQKLNLDMKKTLSKAWTDVVDLQNAELTIISLAELAPESPAASKRVVPKQRYQYDIDDSADSQSGVLAAIKAKP